MLPGMPHSTRLYAVPSMSWRSLLLTGVLLAAALALVAHGPIAQPQAYHQFADQRTLLGLPNFWNVASNLPFLLVGLSGLVALRRRPSGMDDTAYAVFFSGAILVAAGSAAYHLAPSDATLVWDRLPMTLSFAGIVAIVLGDYGDPRVARRALPWLVATGVASVAAWRWTGDLRPYVAVQFLPMLGLPLTMLLFRSRRGQACHLAVALGCYALAKLLEDGDAAILQQLGSVGGHALKHLTAAAGMAAIAFGRTGRERPRDRSFDSSPS